MNVQSAATPLRHPTLAAAAGRWRAALAGALVAGLLALLLPPAWAAVGETLRAAERDRTAARPAKEWPVRPLPREWRWSPPGVDVEHMFRKRR